MTKSYEQVNKQAKYQAFKEDNRSKIKKACLIAIAALLVGFIAYISAINAQDTADINNIFAIVVNNTDLYPTQRTVNTIYYANDSPIAVYIIFHAVGTGAAQTFDSNISINKSVVLDRDFKTSSGAGFHDHWSFYTIVPKGSNYSVTNSTNVFTIEWREYPILSGKNGTLSVNQTFIGSSFNSTYDQTTKAFNSNYTAQTFPNLSIVTNNNTLSSTKVNKTGDTMTGLLNASVGINTTIINLTRNSYIYADTTTLASQTITANTDTFVSWNPITDTLGELKNSKNCTVLNSGNYQISSCIYLTGQKFGNRYYYRPYYNNAVGTFFMDIYPTKEQAANNTELCGSVIKYITAGQNISMAVFTDASAGTSLTADTRSYLTIQKVS